VGKRQLFTIQTAVSFTFTEDIHVSAEFLFTSTRPKTAFRTCFRSISDNAAISVDYAASNE